MQLVLRQRKHPTRGTDELAIIGPEGERASIELPGQRAARMACYPTMDHGADPISAGLGRGFRDGGPPPHPPGYHRPVPTYLQFRVELQHARPPIWRRFLIRPDASFAELHDAIQTACGWKHYHLYCFYATAIGPNPIAGVPDEDYPGMPDAERVPIRTHFGPSRRCLYLYDYGDGWEHEVRLEGAQDLPEIFERKLLDGARSFPPEDCGGISGYEECIALIRKGKGTKAEQRELLKRIGRWHPERFERDKVARQFDLPKARKAAGA